MAIVHPYVAYDLRRNPEWIDVHKYSTPENIYNGEIGKLAGVRFIETSEAKIWTGDGCPTSLAVFGTLVLAAHAYAVTEVEGGGLQHIVKQLGAGEDPLNQRASVAGRPSRPQSGCASSTWYASRASARSTARRRRRTNTLSARDEVLFCVPKENQKAPATSEAREARERGCSPLSDPKGEVETEKS